MGTGGSTRDGSLIYPTEHGQSDAPPPPERKTRNTWHTARHAQSKGTAWAIKDYVMVCDCVVVCEEALCGTFSIENTSS